MINMYLNVIDYDAEIRKRICPGCPIYNTPTCNVKNMDLFECFDEWVENVEEIWKVAKQLVDIT